MKLNALIKIKKDRKVVGRGGATGGTSGKGNKGQKARSGGFVKAQFEGGQTPLTRRLPRRGFNNKNFSTVYAIVSLEKLIALSEKLNCREIDKNILVQAGCIKNNKQKVKILLENPSQQDMISFPLVITVDACSQSVLTAVTNSGGTLILTK